MSRLLYGFSGFIGSGKDAAASALISSTHARKFSFAEALKDAVAAIFSWDRDMIDGMTPESRAWREQRDDYWTNRLGFDVTPRKILQLFGTEVGRSFHPELWISAADRRYKLNPAPISVITDARFGNEMQWVRDQNGVIVWVSRKGIVPFPEALKEQIREYRPLTTDAAQGLLESGLHASETSFLTEGADKINIVLLNNGTLDDLLACVHHIHHVVTTPVEVIPIHGNTTLYLERSLDTFQWTWRTADGELQRIHL